MSKAFTSVGTWTVCFSPASFFTVTVRALLSIAVTVAVSCVVADADPAGVPAGWSAPSSASEGDAARASPSAPHPRQATNTQFLI